MPTYGPGSFDRPARRHCRSIAKHCRAKKRYLLGYLFAERAAEIPLPETDKLFVRRDVHAWRATDEQATCGYRIGKEAEAFTLRRRLLARPDIPAGDRRRIATNRDFSVQTMIEAASSYPDVVVGRLIAGPRDAEVTVSLIAGPDRETTEQTLNSFLHCCTDVSQIGRFLVLDAGLSAQDRARLRERYRFLEFADPNPGDGRGAQLAQLRDQDPRTVLAASGPGLAVFAPDNLITRLTAVLDAEPQVFQVGINLADAVRLTGINAAEQTVRRAPDAGRYVRPKRWPAARRCSTPHDWIGLAVSIAPTATVAEIGRRAPPPDYRPPASTKYSASPCLTRW